MTAQLAMFTDAEETIRQKVDLAFAAPLSDCERDVLTALYGLGAFGKAMILSTDDMHAKWIAHRNKVHDRRKVRAAIKTLIEVYDLPIGSSRIPGDNGYYFLVNDEEAEDASRHLRNEIMSLFRRLKVISPKSAFVKQLQGQIQILSEEANATADQATAD
jgi:hypothetical protein